MVKYHHIDNIDIAISGYKSHDDEEYVGYDSTKQTELVCDICHPSLIFDSTDQFDEHIKKHTTKKLYCSYCGKNNTNIIDLKKHKEISHKAIRLLEKNKFKKLYCSYCGKKISTKSNLKRHKTIHTGEKPYKCIYCEKVCSQNSGLKKHERTHTGEKPYKCIYCEKAFSQQGNLKNHERTHTGEKSYKCIYCEKVCSQDSGLKKHERTHTGEKPYKCIYCEKTCSQQVNLQDCERRMHKLANHLSNLTGDQGEKSDVSVKRSPKECYLNPLKSIQAIEDTKLGLVSHNQAVMIGL